MNDYENEQLAELLFPDITKTPDYYEEMYPPRNLPEGAAVTRFAPSPTGYLHIGGLFGALTDVMTARATGGISYLRIEDTDKKRETADGVSAIIAGLNDFNVKFDEGVTGFGTEKGDYGPYTQSERAEIYQTIAKDLTRKGLAYPCFCTSQELTDMRLLQEEEGELIRGYFGKWARCRSLSLSEIKDKINSGAQWVLRFKSSGSPDKKIVFNDIIRGKIEMPENIIDEVLLKSDGIPTYHFAHVCDDHFMRTTHVIRGEEWISSVPKHIAIFAACGYRAPKYAHTPQVMKIDEEDGGKRKLSKRKDPEAAVSYFTKEGYPADALTEYLLTLLNSGFEDWRRANKNEDAMSYPFKLKKMSSSGCLFDLDKLNDISKNVISKMNSQQVYELAVSWAREYDIEFYALLTRDPDYSRSVLAIDRDVPKPRKDIAVWSQLKAYAAYFYDELFVPSYELPQNISGADAAAILDEYIKIYDENDDKTEWFDKIRALGVSLGFAPSPKEYKASPDSFKGHSGDVSSVIRLAVTGRLNTPDLCAIMRVLGKTRCENRIKAFRGNV